MSDVWKQIDEVYECAHNLILAAAVYAGVALLAPWHVEFVSMAMVSIGGFGGGLQIGWLAIGWRSMAKAKAECRREGLEQDSHRGLRKLKRACIYLASSILSVQGVIVASLVQAGTELGWVLSLTVVWTVLAVVSFRIRVWPRRATSSI